MTLTKTNEVKKELTELESLHRNQVENGKFYRWERKDDIEADFWQARADETKAKILDFKEEHGITTPNWWE